MTVLISNRARKYLERLNEPLKSRLFDSLRSLEKEPPTGDIKPLTGQDMFRLRVGSYRILYKVQDNMIFVTNIAPRGQAYK